MAFPSHRKPQHVTSRDGRKRVQALRRARAHGPSFGKRRYFVLFALTPLVGTIIVGASRPA
jgi:hypothetical protein